MYRRVKERAGRVVKTSGENALKAEMANRNKVQAHRYLFLYRGSLRKFYFQTRFEINFTAPEKNNL